MSYYIQIGSYQDKKRFDDAVKLFDDAGVKTTAFNSPNNFYSLCIDCPFHDYQQAVNVMKFFQIMRNRFPHYVIMEYSDKDTLC